MRAIGVGVNAALMSARRLGSLAFAAASFAAGEHQRGGTDQQGDEFELFHAFLIFCVVLSGAGRYQPARWADFSNG